MLIKFKSSDPRAGMTVQMDSSLAQKFIDEGRASKASEGGDSAIEANAPASEAVASTAKKAVAKKIAAGKAT
ncbi:hypothetical protein JH314_08335 [Xanthomonas campestris]|uniref:hypothetical protein n=1 Tax=Xanthomonas campestris TaxID=339 RepID=UPI002368489B|nr:hypothetical protein [Xanthomonas campestris]WDJ03398.1 hypothetical protein JH314_08335 [Xanthomonas campestris]